MRFSAIRYSFWSSRRWFTRPVTYASSRPRPLVVAYSERTSYAVSRKIDAMDFFGYTGKGRMVPDGFVPAIGNAMVVKSGPPNPGQFLRLPRREWREY